MENLQTKNVLLLGGPRDGTMISVDARAHTVRVADSPDAPYHSVTPTSASPTSASPTVNYQVYAVCVMRMALNNKTYHFGQQDMNTCAVEALVAGYRRPKAHFSDANVALQLVTLVGGDADGMRIAAASLLKATKWPEGQPPSETVVHRGEEYRIATLEGKDGKNFRVGVSEAFADSVIDALIKGYRK